MEMEQGANGHRPTNLGFKLITPGLVDNHPSQRGIKCFLQLLDHYIQHKMSQCFNVLKKYHR